MAGELSARHRRFAEEYSVDHNATRAAVRAGYSEGRAKQTGLELLRRPDVLAEVERLDGVKRVELGWDAVRLVGELELVARGAVEAGAWGAAVRAWEAVAKIVGLFAPRRSEVDVQVVYTLDLGRELQGEVVDGEVVEEGGSG